MFLAQKRGLMSFYYCADDIIDFKDATLCLNMEVNKSC